MKFLKKLFYIGLLVIFSSCKISTYNDSLHEELYDFYIIDNIVEFKCMGDIDKYQISADLYSRFNDWICYEEEVILYDFGKKGLLIFSNSLPYGSYIKIKLHGAYRDKYYMLYCR